MYNKFFGLAEAPFNITPDSRFLFLSKRHREALGALVYGIRERKGFILLTGEIGSGKTTVCRALVHELKADNIHLAVILNPGLSEIELLKAINDEFGIPSYYDTKKGLIDALNHFLISESRQGNNVVLIIDEAQNLEPALLEQIRMLSNLETEDTKLIQIVLMGQPELNDTLALSQLEQLNQRIAVRYHISPLSEEEMQAYIRHRLFVARAKIDVEFTPGAVRLAYGATRGIPRRINVLMDRALLACYVEGSYTVDERIIAKGIQEIAGESPVAKKDETRPNAFASLSGNVFTRRTAVMAASAIAVIALMAVAMILGVRLANMKAERETIAKAAPPHPAVKPDDQGTSETRDSAVPSSGTKAKAAKTPAPAPTPARTIEERRRNLPNWKYEKNAPLVRVNNPRTVFRAAQLSILKTWGIVVDLSELARMGEDVITQGEFKSDKVTIKTVPVPGDYDQAILFDVPLIIKLINPKEDQSDYVVLLQTQGQMATVGDPMWGIKAYTVQELKDKWGGAQTVFVDVNKLGALKKGDRNERVRELQQFLKDFLSDKDKKEKVEVSGLFDVKTTDAIRRFQSYYNLPDNGQLDSLTLLLLNSRMMHNGPHLRPLELN